MSSRWGWRWGRELVQGDGGNVLVLHHLKSRTRASPEIKDKRSQSNVCSTQDQGTQLGDFLKHTFKSKGWNSKLVHLKAIVEKFNSKYSSEMVDSLKPAIESKKLE